MLFTWDNALIGIFFLYGLAFYSMGLALWIESVRASRLRFARSMRLLAAFGFLHGIHEWMDMFDCSCHVIFNITLPLWFFWLRLIILITSFIALIAFGEHMLYSGENRQPEWKIVTSLLVFYGISAVLVQHVYRMDEANWRTGLDVLARYLLAVPGVLLASLALWRQRRVFLNSKLADFVIWLDCAIGGFLLYGVVGQLFPAHSPVFPSNFINSNTFMTVFGFPIQVFRAALAFVIAASMIEVLRALEVESQENLRAIENEQHRLEQQRKQELEQLNAELIQAQAETQHLLEEVQERDMQRGEMLKHITTAQEAERRRIARELHDDIGQVLTGVAMGLRGLSQLVTTKPTHCVDRLATLEGMATSAIADLRHLIYDLRPPQLDDMGLVAALRSMHERLNNRSMPPHIEFQSVGESQPLSPEVETTLYRIAQEAVTNALKYAAAQTIHVTLDCTQGVMLTIADDGKGFDVEKALQAQQDRTSWGLYGIMERTRLVNANLQIESKIGTGTTICVRIPEQCKSMSDLDKPS
jgi:signal transduction histidine kinase